MQRAYVPKYVIGGLIAVVLAGLLVWLIRSEGERTRQAIRDARRDAGANRRVVPQEAPQPAPGAGETANPTSQPDPQKPRIATAADAKPAAVDAPAGAEQDFSLDDHVVFPGLGDEVPKSRSKLPAASPTTVREPRRQKD